MTASSTMEFALIRMRAGRPAAWCSISRADLLQQPLADAVGRDHQVLVGGVAREARQVVEQVRDVLADALVRGEQPVVLVHPRGLRVVVAGADVHVAPDPLGLVAHHHRQLAVRLQADLPVDDVAARVLELAGPADVRLLVEARLQLDEHEHLLAGLGRVDQRLDDRGVAGGAVQRLLDRQHVRVVRGLLDEPLHGGGERVVRVVQEYVGAADRLEHVDRRGRLHLGELRVGRRHERRVLQLGPVEVGDVVQTRSGRAGRAAGPPRPARRRARRPAARGCGRPSTPRPRAAPRGRTGAAAAPSPAPPAGSRRRPPRPPGPRCGSPGRCARRAPPCRGTAASCGRR